MSYAQFGEDLLAWKYFGASFQGRFLDLGAFDGKTRSNTLYLAERGWRGVAVDASWEIVPKILKAFEGYPVEFISAAIGVERSIVPFFDCPSANLSTCSEELLERTPDMRKGNRKRHIASITVEDIVKAFPGDFHFISVDLEGVTFPVLKSIPFDKVGCRMVCAEHLGRPYVEADEMPTMEAFMESMGFGLSGFNRSNLIFVRR